MLIVMILGLILIGTVSWTVKPLGAKVAESHDGFWILRNSHPWTIGDFIKGSITNFGVTMSLTDYFDKLKRLFSLYVLFLILSHKCWEKPNFIYINGVIDSLTYQSSQGITVDIFFLKVGIIFTIFLMPICSGCSIIWFIIKRLIFKK